jgi:uncharacterized protein YlxW (UPF0749 family)
MHIKHKRDLKFVLIIAFMLLGFLVSSQFRSVLINDTQKNTMMERVNRLRDQAKEYDSRIADLKKQITQNENKNDKLMKSVAVDNHSSYMATLYQELEDAKLKAGLVDVKGPGVTIELNDAAEATSDQFSDFIVHDSYLVKVVNELRCAGAQAISINGERILGTTEQVCAGTTIRINNNRYPVPYMIQAIGNPDILYNGLINSKVVADMMNTKVRVDINKSDGVLIPKYMGGNLDNLISAMEVAKDETK